MIDPIQKEAIVKLNQRGMTAAMIARLRVRAKQCSQSSGTKPP